MPFFGKCREKGLLLLVKFITAFAFIVNQVEAPPTPGGWGREASNNRIDTSAKKARWY